MMGKPLLEIEAELAKQRELAGINIKAQEKLAGVSIKVQDTLPPNGGKAKVRKGKQ